MDHRTTCALVALGLTGLIGAISINGKSDPPVKAPAATAGMPSYCGTKATEKLPECGWTQEAEDKAAAAQKQARKYDSCAGASEAEVRKMWATVSATQPAGTDVTRTTAELLESAEKLCREWRDAKPTPLPSELKGFVR
jgi:hypothetical protein